MCVALAAGLVTDTAWLRVADGPALRRLANVLEAADLYLEDVLAAIDSPARQAERRAAVLAALRGVTEWRALGWSVLSAETDSHDHGFALVAALQRLGGDVRVVAFPRDHMAMAMIECDAALVEQAGVDLARLAARVGVQAGAVDCWGTRMWGRVVAPVPVGELLRLCTRATVHARRIANK